MDAAPGAARSIKPGYAWLPPTAVGLLEGPLHVEAWWALSRVGAQPLFVVDW